MKKILVIVAVLFLLAGCVTPTPQVIEKYPTAEAYAGGATRNIAPVTILTNDGGNLVYARVYEYKSLSVDCIYFYGTTGTNELSCNWK